MKFPSKSSTEREVIKRMEAYRRRCSLHRYGRNWGMGFYPPAIALKAMDAFIDTNVILAGAGREAGNPLVGITDMENEVISMMGSVFNHDAAVGNITSGGTESNILAIKAARELSKNKKGSVVFSENAHPSISKACHILGLEAIKVPTGKDFLTDSNLMEESIRDDTIAIVGTCGTHTHGAIDPIAKIGKIAQNHELFYHVDAAWGGLICCWLRRAGLYEIPEFDFIIPAVDSMTVDPHKQGFAPMPAGGVLFRNEEQHNAAAFELSDKKYGNYFSWTLQGSRSGGYIAAVWALFNYYGEEGYLKLAKKCMKLTYTLINGVKKIPGLSVPVEPKMNIFATYSDDYNVLDLVKQMESKGWGGFHVNITPPSFRLVVLPHHEERIDEFLSDLEISVRKVKNSKPTVVPRIETK
jgi:tyrosine decarboxylase/aspartate 1-decarboxylase